MEEHHHEHTHDHTHAETKAVVNRLSRAIGHLEAVKAMVEEGRDCTQVLIQLAAVKSAINNTGKLLLKAAKSGDRKAFDDLNEAIDRFLK